jgi:hypothetical protein
VLAAFGDVLRENDDPSQLAAPGPPRILLQ